MGRGQLADQCCHLLQPEVQPGHPCLEGRAMESVRERHVCAEAWNACPSFLQGWPAGQMHLSHPNGLPAVTLHLACSGPGPLGHPQAWPSSAPASLHPGGEPAPPPCLAGSSSSAGPTLA